jgi:hypothetical protein
MELIFKIKLRFMWAMTEYHVAKCKHHEVKLNRYAAKRNRHVTKYNTHGRNAQAWVERTSKLLQSD